MYFPSWVKNAVAYQIFPDRFSNLGQAYPCQPWGSTPQYDGKMGGTFKGIESKISYLEGLGVNLIYLNPIFASPSNHRYDAMDYFSPDPILGTLEDFGSLASALHKNDMRLMLDIAFNHTSNMHPRFLDAISGHDESRNWYHIHDGDRYDPGWVRAQGVSYLGWWGYPHLPVLNIGSEQVRAHHNEVIRFWSGLGADGFRFDVASDINDPSFWKSIANSSKSALRIAELWWDQKDWLLNNDMHGQMNYPLLYAMLNFFAYEHVIEDKLYSSGLGDGYFNDMFLRTRDQDVFLDTISRLFALSYDQDSLESNISMSNLNLLGSHDTARIASYLPDKDIRKQLFAFIFFSVGMPCIYYGDETGMRGNKDPDNRRAFNWDSSSWDMDLFGYVKELISFRKNSPAFLGSYQIAPRGEGLVEVTREYDGDKALAVFNRSKDDKSYGICKGLEEVITGTCVFDNASEIIVPAHGVRIFRNQI
ncbi:MAG: alpha-amylase family glycosyl hydrolase [Candidatus Woesearchaeota archaeon]|nr:alpha-amylase family glycosyl hydrolase [Candidatus Woesearchaeota archaeon]